MTKPADKRGDDGDGDSSFCSAFTSPEYERIRRLYMHPVSIFVYLICLAALVSGIVLICAANQPHCAEGCASQSCVETSTTEDGQEVRQIYHCFCPDDSLEGFYCGKKVQRKQDQMFYTVGICLIVLCPFLLLNMRAWFGLLGYRNNLVLVADGDDVEDFNECDEENMLQKPRSGSDATEVGSVCTDSTSTNNTHDGNRSRSRSLPSRFPVNLRNNRAEFESGIDHQESTFADAQLVSTPIAGDMELVDVVMEQV